ncbi:hypothetical protein FB451DRAFT_1166215 [Mycena latifolia]|nr:hypothetical protein FB451DRAFT_1166215 [Mycena latifolia]
MPSPSRALKPGLESGLSKCGAHGTFQGRHTLFIHGTLLLSAAHQGQVRHTIYDTCAEHIGIIGTLAHGSAITGTNEQVRKVRIPARRGLSTILHFKHEFGLVKEFKKY